MIYGVSSVLFAWLCNQGQQSSGSVCLRYLVEITNWLSPAITALATVAVAAFTFVLYRATTAQGRLTQQSIDLARAEYISTHRPRVRIRMIVPTLVVGEPITVSCTVVNLGETSARVEWHEAKIYIRSVRGEKLESDLVLIGSDLAGGQSEVFHTQKGTSFAYEDSWQVGTPHAGQMSIRGTVEYLDDNNVTRRTGFYRRYDRGRGFFCDTIMPEYEYED